ncbi:MAG: chorismate synthase [Eubacteriales bacterium]
MSSYWGKRIHLSIFGQSHAPSVGVVIDGLPAGERVDTEALAAFLRRRAPGQGSHTTARAEPDRVIFESGLRDGVLCGAPLCARIENTDVRPGDYASLADRPRPGHADFSARVKYGGYADPAGGGHFSGRLTAPLCVAGGICLQLLAKRGILVGAHVERIAGVTDTRFDPVRVSGADFTRLVRDPFPVISAAAGQAMLAQIEAARAEGDSVGGVVECAVVGLPAGLGEPMFEGLENRIASLVFGIPAVRGIEFGAGFESAERRGSEHNDPFVWQGGQMRTETNRHGGILGGISTGMPLLFRVAVKPTPSIAKEQRTVDLHTRTEVTIRVGGRHDPCIVPRALPAIEAAAAIALYDCLLDSAPLPSSAP